MADNLETKVALAKKSLPRIVLKLSKSKQNISLKNDSNSNQVKFKVPKHSPFKNQQQKINSSILNPSDHLNLSLCQSANRNVSTLVTVQSNASNKNYLNEELAADQSTSKVLKSTSNPRDSKMIKPDGFSLTTSPVLGVNQNIQNLMSNNSNVYDQLKLDNKKRISLMKKTTLVQDLENMQAINELSTFKNQQLKNEQAFDLGLVPIDIYTTSDFETADQIVEARGYILQERIGSGAFANVHKAWHMTEQIYTACKIIELKKKKKKRLNDLKHELYVLDKMDHINIIKLYEHFLIDEKVYIFLEYASCGTLSEYVRKRGPLKENRARKWFKQICSGLYHMHSHGISHRDL